MRVALVFHDFYRGESLPLERVILARGLATQGVEVHVYANPDGRLEPLDGVEFHDVRPLMRSRGRVGHAVECGSFAWRATRVLRERRRDYDIIDASGTSSWEHDVVRVHAVQLAMQRRWPDWGGRDIKAARLHAAAAPVVRPTVGIARATQKLQFRPGRFLRAAAVTELVADDLVSVFGIPRDLVDVVPYPIEAPGNCAAREEFRRQLGLASHTPLALFVGHDFQRKGLDVAIRALGEAPGEAQLAVVGGGDGDPFRAEAERQGLSHRVHFLGPTIDAGPWFAAADVFVLPTREDVWAMVVIEAMASGLPVITTAGAGASAVVEESRAGIVVAEPQPAKVAAALTSLLEDGRQREMMGKHGRLAAERYGEKAHALAMLDVYERALAARERVRTR